MGITDIEQHDWSRGGLVPPRRLGALLSSARASNGLTLEDVVHKADGVFNLSALASIERGTTYLTDSELRWLADLYGIQTTELVPSRSKLVIDLDDGVLQVPEHRRVKVDHHAGRDEVLSRYLAMVYSMRRIDPGTRITLRVDDLETLGKALGEGPSNLSGDLQVLMMDDHGLVSDRFELLRRKVLVPAAGILVALLGAAALVLVQNHGASGEVNPVDTVTAVSGQTGVGNAAVQTRNADGTPGPMEVRNG